MPDYRAATRRAAQKHGLDPAVFERQIQQESGFNPTIRSPAGAVGIAQIMPATARGWGINPLDPIASLDAAARNMAQYVKQYGGYENALRAYNAGPGAIERSKGFTETNNYVRTILGGHTPKTPSASSASSADESRYKTVSKTTPGVDNRQARAQLILSFLNQKDYNPVQFATQAAGLRDVAPTTTTSRQRIPGGGDGAAAGGGGLAATATGRADVINQQKLPYSWGGGHAGQTPVGKAVPLDCSGAVSKVLGIDPRVSGEFSSWGRPGDGGDTGVTVYSNNHHVLMKINGHFFGTSASNPGGGAGWIPADAISPEYLQGFTARHSAR